MALEFNADKEIIKSDQLKIKNDTSVRFDIGGGADEKVALFGSLTNDVDKLVRVGINTTAPNFELDVNGQIRTTTSIISDTARINNLDIDTIVNPSLNLKAPVLNSFTDPNTGEVFFPRSATPAFNDDSNKIATTNFVYNIATNDVGGRIYVSAQIGNDSFDGRSATKPVATIKRATQLAAETGDKETLIVAGGDYLEDNPISLPDLCSVVGDNIRLCIIRPQNPGKHMFKASNENYVTGITFRDQIDGNGVALKTWNFAYVFDDKQRFFYPKSLGGQYGRTFNLGHEIQAPQKWSLKFSANGGGVLLVAGLTVTNTTTNGTGVITEVNFDDNTDQSGTATIESITGLIESTGATYEYTANTPAQTYTLSVDSAEQLTPDAQVVKHVTSHTTLAVDTIKSDLNAYPQGMIVTTTAYHDYEVGQYVYLENLPSTGTFADLNRLNGRQYVSHRIETADGFSTQFVIFKDTPVDLVGLGVSNGTYNASAVGATVVSDDHYVVFSLNNSPIKFEESVKSPNRYLDAVDLIGKNREGIAAESLRRAKAEYTSLVVPDEAQCKTDIGHIVNAINYDLTWGGNAATKEAADYYYDAGALTHIENQLKETTYAFEQARDLSIQAMRNQLTYVDTSSTGTFTRVSGYTGSLLAAIWDNEKFVAVGDFGAIHTSPDGSTWTAQTSGTSSNFTDIIWNKWAVGERGVPEYLAVGSTGTIVWSNNGEDWNTVTSGVTDTLNAIAYNGSTYVVVGGNGTVVYSSNVTTWQTGTSGVSSILRDIIYNDDCDKFIAVGDSGVILESVDGNTWTAQESGTSNDLRGITWTEGRMVATSTNGKICISSDNGLTWETNYVTSNVEADRYQDAADLILENKKLIAAQAVYSYINANSFTIPTGNQNCVDDVVDVIEAIAHDIRHGGNAASYDAASYYVGTTHVDGEEAETVAIINNARDLAKDAMRNISITLSYLTNSTYTATLESQFTSGIVQFTKPDISLDGSDPATACANVASSIDTLASIVTTAVTNDNLNHATKTLPTGNIGTNNFGKVVHDGHQLWAQYNSGSSSYIYNSGDKGRTWNLSHTSNSGPTYAFAFSYTKGVVLGANNADILFDGVGNEFDSSINITAFEDETISNTYDSNRFFACDNVASSLFTLWNIVIDRINGRAVPTTTNATSSFVDSNNKFFNVGHAWDDLPIIEVSPYIFNASVISFLGGSGCEIDGNKVATPNVKRPNLPPQGKSMVAAAFTIISFGGTGYDVFNDGYTQLVSVYEIDGAGTKWVRSGGYASLTNSASNFGTFSLRSTGVRSEAYTFDKGTIDNVTFDDINRPEVTISGLGTKPLEHYIFAPGGFEIETVSGQNPRVFNEKTNSSTGGTNITAEILLNKANMRLRGNLNRYTDASNLLEKNARFIAEEAYFTTAATSSNSFDQNRDKCIRDVEEIIKAWSKDIKFDANDATWDAAKLYVSGNAIQHVAGYEAATKEVVDTATTLAKKAINNLLQKKGETATSADYYVAQWTDELPYVDTTITHDISSSGGNYVSGDCANVQSAIQTLSDLFDEIIDNPTVTTPMPGGTAREDGYFTLGAINKAKLIDHDVDLLRPSICNSSSHTWEFSGSGNDYNALPQNGGTRGSDDTEDFEQVSQLNGRVYASGTDELGDFKIGYFANVENRTGNITFGGTVEISEVSFLKITGNNLVIEGFSADNTLGSIALGGPGASDNLLPTQKAVKDYISNQLGSYIGRTYSTVPTPNALVQLDGSGRINIDQLPALRPFNIFTVADQAARLALEGPLAGDIAIQQDTTISFILNNDLESQILEFVPNSSHSFAVGNITTASPGGGQGQVTNFLEGTVKQIIVNNGGTGYASGDTITFTAPSGGTAATGTLSVNGGQITGVTLTSGGDNYFTAPSTAAGTITITTSTGSNAVLTSSIRSRLSIDIINNIKTVETDTIDDQSNPANTITLTSAINTSASNANNWVQLTSSTIDASFITTGVINPARLANITAANPANDLTYLRGDSTFAEAVSSIRISDDSPISLGSQNSASDYIKEVQIEDGGSGYTVGTYTSQAVTGGNVGSEGLKATYIVANGVVQKVTMSNQGTGYDAANPPTVLFKDTWTTPGSPQVINSIIGVPVINSSGNITDVYLKDGGSGLGSNVPTIEFEGGGGVDAAGTATVTDGAIRKVTVTSQGSGFTSGYNVSSIPSGLGSPTTAANLFAIFATVPKIYNDAFIDIRRVDGNTASSELFGKLGVSRFLKSQFNFLSDGGVELKTGNASGLDADLLDGLDSTYFTNATNISQGTLNKDRLPGEISSNTTGNAATSSAMNVSDAKTSIFAPSNFASGLRYQLKDNNDALNYLNTNEYLDDGGLYHGVLTFRRGGASTTFSDGAITQHANTDNGNLFLRNNGVNRVASLSITQAGAGYVDGTYSNILLGGGEGYGLKANLTVSGGSFTNVELVDGGWGYNKDGSATTTFTAILPYEYFGEQNTRNVTTIATITATLPSYVNFASVNTWSQWRKVWHDGNDGVGSGLDADLFQAHNLRWFNNPLNLNYDTQLMTRKIPTQLDEHAINSELRITVPSPTFQTNNGGHYDIYINGYNLTSEVVAALDTDAGVSGTQLNLYTANNVNEGTVRLIARRINLDPANYETGSAYVETNTEWSSGLTGLDRNDRIVYGHNVYRVANANSGSYTGGTVAPTHISGQVTATGGTAIFEFERKVENPWTILTVELTSGNFTRAVRKIGTATAPAEYYPVTEFGVTAVENYSRRKARLGSDATGTAFLELGNVVESTTPYIDFNSSGNNVDFDVRIQASSGSSTVGTGILNFRASNAQVNGNNIWHAGNIGFTNGIINSGGTDIYDTSANSKAVLRSSAGNFAANNIIANSFIGVATGNLPLTGGSLTGNLLIKSGNYIQFETSSNTARGFIQATETDGAHLTIATSGGEDIAFKDGGLSGTTNMVIQGDGRVGIGRNPSFRLDVGAEAATNQTVARFGSGGSDILITHQSAIISHNSYYFGGWNSTGSGKASLLNFQGGIFQVQHTSSSAASAGDSISFNVTSLNIAATGHAAFSGAVDTNYSLKVHGTFAATSKSFVIDHPTKEDYQLVYGSLEGPEHGVYVRGKVTDGVIELPDYWSALVDEDTITVQLTAIGDSGNRWVVDVADNKVTTGGGAAFYFVQAERKDIDKLTVEVEVVKEED